jgi:hypothetical protein
MMKTARHTSMSMMRKSLNKTGSYGIQLSREARQMAEISTAQASDGSVTVQSPQTEPTPKSASDKDSGTTAPSSKRKGSAITTKAKRPEVNERGVVKTQWDNPAADPNLRKHIGESPDGEGNEIPE